MARIRRARTGSYPTTPLPGAAQMYEADSGLGALAIGAPAPTWQDGTGLGATLGPFLGTVAPTFQRDDDQLPYLAFDGVSPNGSGLTTAILPAFVGLHLTVYAVVRPRLALVATGNGNKLLALGRAGQISGAGAGTVALRRTGAAGYNLIYEGVGQGGDGSTQTGVVVSTGVWDVCGFRAAVRGGISYVHFFRSGMTGWGLQWGLVPTALPARNYTQISLGWDVGSGTDFLPCDWRALSIYHVGHSDRDVRTQMRYYAHKWNVPVLD